MLTVHELAQQVATEMSLTQRRNTKVDRIEQRGIAADIYFLVNGIEIGVGIQDIKRTDLYSPSEIVDYMIELLDVLTGTPIVLN